MTLHNLRMRILVFESNLMWGPKLRLGIEALGHEAIFLNQLLDESGDFAIVNLSQPKPDPRQLIADLHGKGIKVIAHAGHKEKDLLHLGREAGADFLVTNGELSAKLGNVLERVSK